MSFNIIKCDRVGKYLDYWYSSKGTIENFDLNEWPEDGMINDHFRCWCHKCRDLISTKQARAIPFIVNKGNVPFYWLCKECIEKL